MVPAWLLDCFATMMLAVAAISAGRLAAGPRRGPRADADIDVAHLLMGIAMAGMLVGGLRTLPSGAWEVIFAGLLGWFGWRVGVEAQHRPARALAGVHHTPHLVHSAAMLYMFLALGAPHRGGSAMAGMSGAGGTTGTLSLPTLAFVFALLMAGFTVLDLDRLSSGAARTHGAPRLFSSQTMPLAMASAVGGGTGSASAGFNGPGTGAGPANVAGADERVGARTNPVSGSPAGGAARCQPIAGRPGADTARGSAAGRGSRTGRLLDPGVATGCRIATGITMVLMLMIMI
jgi:Domain of unknown function (DUF5134)